MNSRNVVRWGILVPMLAPLCCRVASAESPQPLLRSADQLQVYTDPGELPQFEVRQDGKTLKLPLEHTDVQADIVGYVARVTVTQTYGNPYTDPIEAVYIFPLPENSAVDDMKMVIGERIIESDIQKRDQARQTYQQAKQQGQTAALLEQERPNVFTQSVANIAPGERINVVIRYVQNLTYDAGAYEFVFPMVVGPRFIPGNPSGTASGLGYAKDTDRVPDASRISPPVIGTGVRSGHDISIAVRVDAGLAIKTWEVPTHDVDARAADPRHLQLKLKSHDSLPNRDFVMKYRVDGNLPQVALLQHHDKKAGYFSLMIQPPTLDVDALVGSREIIFVMDVSGSMHGVPLSMCKDAMREALQRLRPVDTFNVLTFSGQTAKLWQQPMPANQAHLQQATSFIDGLRAAGGTMMGPAVQEALQPAVQAGRHRYVFFMTDGYTGEEEAIMQGARKLVTAQEERGQRAKVFSFGVGSSVNRHLIDGMAKAGKGLAVYASTRQDPADGVNKFFHYIDHAVLTDLAIDWGGLVVEDLYPATLPDLFASRPLIVQGRLRGMRDGTVNIRGLAQGRRVELPLKVTATSDGEPVLETLWARAKIDSLEQDLAYSGQTAATVDAITALGLTHRLVTRFTSFVAVDKSRTVNGTLKTILQPVETPEGVDAMMAGAQIVGAAPGSLAYLGRRSMMAPPAPTSAADGEHGAGAGLTARKERQSIREEAPTETRLGSREVTGKDDADELVVAGGLEERGLRQALATLKTAMAGCASGTLRVRWFITATGQVIQARVIGGSIKDKASQECVLSALRKVTFSLPADGKPAEVIFTFHL